MSNYLLFLPILFPILIAFIIRVCKLNGKYKEILNLVSVIINSLLTLAFVIFPPSDMVIIPLKRSRLTRWTVLCCANLRI